MRRPRRATPSRRALTLAAAAQAPLSPAPARPRIVTSRCAGCGLGLVLTLTPADTQPAAAALERLICLRCQLWPKPAEI